MLRHRKLDCLTIFNTSLDCALLSGQRLLLHTTARALWFAFAASVVACSTFTDHRKSAFARAEQAHFTISQLHVGDFELMTFHRGLAGATSVIVYIEGDGHVARTRTRLSNDPTPHSPVGLELAMADRSPAVLYIARPCQYLTEEQLSQCSPRYWSLARYAEKVIAATNEAIEWGLATTNTAHPGLGLVGYSGRWCGRSAGGRAARRR